MADNDYTGVGKVSQISATLESTERLGRVVKAFKVDNAKLGITYSAGDTLTVATIPAGSIFVNCTVQVTTACASNIKAQLGATDLHTASKAVNTILAGAAGNTYTQVTTATALKIHNAGANATGVFNVIVEYFQPLN